MSGAVWVNRPMVAAIRRTSVDDTISLDVEGKSTISSDIDRVVITISVGAWQQIHTVSSRSMRFPNFSEHGSRLPGGGSSTLASIYCFGVTIRCGDIPAGKVRIDADVYFSPSAPKSQLQTLLLLNDWDGRDSRGSSVVIYQKGQTGNDITGTGSFSNPVKSLSKALSLVRNNPNGNPNDPVHMRCGGGKIVCDELTIGCGPYTFNWVSEDQWVTFEALPGFEFQRDPDDSKNYLYCSGINEVGYCNIRFSNWTMRGNGPVLWAPGWPVSNVRIKYWFDNLEKTSKFWNPSIPHSVRYIEDDGAPASVASADPAVMAGSEGFLTGNYWHHVGYGPASQMFIYDLRLDHYIGIALQSEGNPGDAALNVYISDQTRTNHSIVGWLRTQGGTSFTVSEPSAGIMRVEQTGPVNHRDDPGTLTPTNIATKWAPLVGTTHWQAHFVEFGANSGIFPIVGAGTTVGGNPYIEVSISGRIPSITPGVAPATAMLRTGQSPHPTDPYGPAQWGTLNNFGTRPYDPHPDLIQWLGNRQYPIYMHIRAENIRESQGYFLSGNPTGLILFNATDGGHGIRHPMGNLMTDCYIGYCSFTGSIDFSSGAAHTGILTHVVANFFNNINTSLLQCSYNHCISGSAPGSNPSTGAFYRIPTNQAPWSFEPDSPHIATGDPDVNPAPLEWRWSGAKIVSSRGAFANTGLGNWGNPSQDLQGVSSGISNDSASLIVRRTLSGSSAGSSSDSASIKQIYAMLGVSFGTSLDEADLNIFGIVTLTGSSAGLSSSTAALRVLRSLSGTSAGTSFSSGSLTGAGGVALAGSSFGTSLDTASLILPPPTVEVVVTVTAVVTTTGILMKQRIHNAILAVVKAGPYYVCKIDPKTGQMTIDLNAPVKPTGITIKEVRRSSRLALKYKRSGLVSEIESWPWIVQLEFPALEVAFEVFENNLMDTCISIPPVIGAPDQRPLLARWADSDYSPPPEQSPNSGTFATITFEILPETLRK